MINDARSDDCRRAADRHEPNRLIPAGGFVPPEFFGNGLPADVATDYAVHQELF
jgi:hypothetical protein